MAFGISASESAIRGTYAANTARDSALSLMVDGGPTLKKSASSGSDLVCKVTMLVAKQCAFVTADDEGVDRAQQLDGGC